MSKQAKAKILDFPIKPIRCELRRKALIAQHKYVSAKLPGASVEIFDECEVGLIIRFKSGAINIFESNTAAPIELDYFLDLEAPVDIQIKHIIFQEQRVQNALSQLQTTPKTCWKSLAKAKTDNFTTHFSPS